MKERWLSGSHSCNNPPNRRKRISGNWQLLSKNQTCLLFHPSTAVHVVRHPPASYHEASNMPMELAGSGIHPDSKRTSLMPRVNEVKRPQVRPRVFSKRSALCLKSLRSHMELTPRTGAGHPLREHSPHQALRPFSPKHSPVSLSRTLLII